MISFSTSTTCLSSDFRLPAACALRRKPGRVEHRALVGDDRLAQRAGPVEVGAHHLHDLGVVQQRLDRVVPLVVDGQLGIGLALVEKRSACTICSGLVEAGRMIATRSSGYSAIGPTSLSSSSADGGGAAPPGAAGACATAFIAKASRTIPASSASQRERLRRSRGLRGYESRSSCLLRVLIARKASCRPAAAKPKRRLVHLTV